MNAQKRLLAGTAMAVLLCCGIAAVSSTDSQPLPQVTVPVATTALAVETQHDGDAVSALMAGNAVGRRGCSFGRRLPVSLFVP